MEQLEKCLSSPSRVNGDYLNSLSEKKRVLFDEETFNSFKSFDLPDLELNVPPQSEAQVLDEAKMFY